MTFPHLSMGSDNDGLLPRAAAKFIPRLRVFTHTCGLDHRLFDENAHLRPDVRRYIMSTMALWWSQSYEKWSAWSQVYFAGSEASEWTSDTLEGNNDFDVLVGVDYDGFRKANPTYQGWTNQQITDAMNLGFRQHNGPTMIVVDGSNYGPFDRTTYVNPDSYDIRDIKPYAAYNVSKDEWAVRPPHLPHWSLSELPRAVQRVLKACDRLANDILKLPEPERTQQGAALFDAWHSDRSRAFGPNGEGWYDIANLREKWLDQEGIWAEIVNCKHRFNEGLGAASNDWSNTPPGYKIAGKTTEIHFLKESYRQITPHDLYGSNDVDKFFGDRLTSPTPFQSAGRVKSHKDYDESLVARSITHPHEFPIQDVDPRELRATQASVTKDGVSHYMRGGSEYGKQNGDHRLGNDVPRIYHREDGQKLILSGHHRATAALLKGEPLKAIVIKGPWGGPRIKGVRINEYEHDPDRIWYQGRSKNRPDPFTTSHPGTGQSGDWNSLIGHHFSSEKDVAQSFGKHVYHVNLHMQNPKIYSSEAVMDNEVMQHEHESGNHYTKHLDPSFEHLSAGNAKSGWKADKALRNGNHGIAEDNSHFWLSSHPDKKGIVSRFKQRLTDAGYDGIVYGNDFEKPGHASAIALHPERIEIHN
jgi:hypothetical protein